MKDFLEFYELFLVWPVAFLGVVALVGADTIRGRILAGIFIVALFTPFIHRSIGNWYFEYLCKHEAGEFIYRTVQGVEGVLQMRPRDGSRDYFERMAEGDLPEDPWGHTNAEARFPWTLMGEYRFLESFDLQVKVRAIQVPPFHPSMIQEPTRGDVVVRYFGYDRKNLDSLQKQYASSVQSKYGFSWSGSSNGLSKFFDIHKGEVTVHELTTRETLALMRGFLRVSPYRICGPDKHEFFVRDFLAKVLKPVSLVP